MKESCTDVKEELPALLDGEIKGAYLLEMIDHLAVCADCRLEAENHRRAWEGFKSLYHKEPLPLRLRGNPFSVQESFLDLAWVGRALAWTPALAATALSVYLSVSPVDDAKSPNDAERIPAAGRLAALNWDKLLSSPPRGLRAAPVAGGRQARLLAAPRRGSNQPTLSVMPVMDAGVGGFKARLRLEANERGLLPQPVEESKSMEVKS